MRPQDFKLISLLSYFSDDRPILNDKTAKFGCI